MWTKSVGELKMAKEPVRIAAMAAAGGFLGLGLSKPPWRWVARLGVPRGAGPTKGNSRRACGSPAASWWASTCSPH